jgi:hypothetical protein
MYLAFLLNVFYMLYILIFIYIIGQYFFIWCFMKYVYLRDRCRTCTCRTYSEPMCYPFGNDASHMNLWDPRFLNCPAYFGQRENDDRCMLSGVCLCVSFVHNFSSITLLLSDALVCDQRTTGLCYWNHEWMIHKADTR